VSSRDLRPLVLVRAQSVKTHQSVLFHINFLRVMKAHFTGWSGADRILSATPLSLWVSNEEGNLSNVLIAPVSGYCHFLSASRADFSFVLLIRSFASAIACGRIQNPRFFLSHHCSCWPPPLRIHRASP